MGWLQNLNTVHKEFPRYFKNHLPLFGKAIAYQVVRHGISKKTAFAMGLASGKYVLGDNRAFFAENNNFIREIWVDKIYEKYPGFTPQKGWTVIDLGACSGEYSVYASVLGAKVLAFEPHPDHFGVLSKNASRFPNISPYPFAASNKTGFITLHSTTVGAHSIMHGAGTPLKVYTVSLDEFLPDLKSIDLLKMDIEGAELQVLQGAKKLLKRTKRVVAEIHGDLWNPCEKLLKQHGFKIEVYRPSKDAEPILYASR